MCRRSAGVAARTSSLQLRAAESNWRGESSSPVQRRSEQQLQHGHLNINACRDDISPAHTHTHTRLTALFSGTTRASRYQKGKNQSGFY